MFPLSNIVYLCCTLTEGLALVTSSFLIAYTPQEAWPHFRNHECTLCSWFKVVAVVQRCAKSIYVLYWLPLHSVRLGALSAHSDLLVSSVHDSLYLHMIEAAAVVLHFYLVLTV
ncbi:hypothetical protein SCP_0701270 [Sparassis crispa]|uniref:Uncharacterized protein n=1 Tax=Sparassis crispa TaxID=139825 RepID=A0A401GRV0_9APHY|nr:hypothetical protein SCP_0701270 [Sparassis crispa]GBE84945.1 hypothetical protein SCP_0701270 [Sparassis crispa]